MKMVDEILKAVEEPKKIRIGNRKPDVKLTGYIGGKAVDFAFGWLCRSRNGGTMIKLKVSRGFAMQPEAWLNVFPVNTREDKHGNGGYDFVFMKRGTIRGV
jgi:hypothetical protein